jgi:hypothetical protein
MSEREKIERLAKAMGHDVWRNDQGFTIIDGLHSDWNPWKNPEDLRPVLEYIETSDVFLRFNRRMEIIGKCGGAYTLLTLIINCPGEIADAALAVLEGDPCTK